MRSKPSAIKDPIVAPIILTFIFNPNLREKLVFERRPCHSVAIDRAGPLLPFELPNVCSAKRHVPDLRPLLR
jgi:hypothetical protein